MSDLVEINTTFPKYTVGTHTTNVYESRKCANLRLSMSKLRLGCRQHVDTRQEHPIPSPDRMRKARI